jgi:hypothetical protein
MLVNQESAQAFKNAITKLYNQFSQKYNASYPKGYQALGKIQQIYTAPINDLDELIKSLIEAKGELKGGDTFRITSASYVDLTAAIDGIINHFNAKRNELAKQILSQEQAITIATSSSMEPESLMQKLMDEMENMKLAYKQQVDEQATKLKEIQSQQTTKIEEIQLKYDDKFEGLDKNYAEKLNQKQLDLDAANRQADEENAKFLDKKALRKAQKQHLESKLRRIFNNLEDEAKQVELKTDNDDNRSVATSVASSIKSSRDKCLNETKRNDLVNRFGKYENTLSLEQEKKLAKISFALFNLLGIYDEKGNLFDSKQPKVNGLENLEAAIEFLFNGNMKNAPQFLQDLADATQNERLKSKFKVVGRELEGVNENLFNANLKALQKFILQVYPQPSKRDSVDDPNLDINHSLVAKSAYNYGVRLLNKLKQQASNEQKQQEETVSQPRLGQ